MMQNIPPDNAGGLPPAAFLMQMLSGAQMHKSIWVVAKLGIADLLIDKPKTAEELAAATDTHAPSLYRVLRALASLGFFHENASHEFALTPLGAVLRSDTRDSMRDFAIMLGEDWIWNAWNELMYSVQTGGVAHDRVQGMSSFEFFSKNEEAGRVFNRAMTNLTKSMIPAILEAYDFSDIGKLVDIAGGHGLLLASILKANPNLLGILFDLPYVIAGAGELLEKEGVRDRVEIASGDFFQSVPEGADAYMMKHIVHDWDDEHAIQLLKNVQKAMKKNGKVLIIEMVLPEGNDPHPAKSLDLVMLVMEGGKERTKAEYKELLAASGLKLTKITPTRSPYSVVEGERA